MSKQPEALRLADALENNLEQYDGYALPPSSQDIADAAAAELRRLHAVNSEMLEALKKIVRDADAEPDEDYLIGANKGCVAVHRSGIEIARAAITKAEAT